MLKEEITSLKSGTWGRACDTCHVAASTVYCRADSAYLCTTCDADIHSANPLASRHHRVPVMPIPGSLYGPQAVDQESVISMGDTEGGFLSQEAGDTLDEEDDNDDDEAASWLLFNPPVKNGLNQNNTNGFFLGGEGADEYLDLVEYNSCQDNQFSSDHIQYNDQQFSDDHYSNQQQQCFTVPQKSYGGETDSVVPVQFGEAKNYQIQQQNFQHQKLENVFEYETSNNGYAYPASLSHSISMSSMELSVVPESAMSDVSISHPRPPKGRIDLFSSSPIQMATQLTPIDREARVLRYREKKKTRKFEKTIRYASRKAYAETRPRIKGRFSKRTDADIEVDQMFSTALMAENGYGIVPSFQLHGCMGKRELYSQESSTSHY